MNNKKNSKEELVRDSIKKDLDSNVFVEAGAGAGKTRLLVERILNQIKSGRWTVDQIVAITFTNKAAQELKKRIGDALVKEIQKTSGNADTEKCLRKALQNLNLMQISTIHSFCFRLLKEQTFLAGMRMDMQMLENDEEKSRIDDFFQKWYHDDRKGENKYTKFRELYLGKKPYQTLKDAFALICNLDDDVVFDTDRSTWFNTSDEIDDYFENALREFKAHIIKKVNEKIPNGNYKTIEELQQQDLFKKPKFSNLITNFKNEILNGIGSRDFLNEDEEKKEKWKIIKSRNAKDSKIKLQKNDVDEINESCWQIVHGPDGIARKVAAFQNALIFDFVKECRDNYRKIKENRFVTNDLLLQKTRDLVKNNPSAREVFAKKFRTIYIDEFQDTDPVQTELLLSLCRDEQGSFRKGSLFVVGDPKQSIYRFRGADLHLYYRTKKLAENNGFKVYTLNYNYRSNDEVIDFINKNNTSLMDWYQGDGSAAYENMVSMVEKKNSIPSQQCLAGVYHLGNPTTNQARNKNERDAETAKDINNLVSIISGLVQNKVLIWDKDANQANGEYRPIEYRDFLVLCADQFDMELYMDAMLQAGIPVQISGKIDISEQTELQRFYSLYRYLAYPNYRRALESARQTIMHKDSTAENVAEADSRLNKLYDETKELDGSGCVYYLIRHLEYLLDLNSEKQKNNIIRLQAQLQQMCEAILSKAPNNRQAIAEAISEYFDTDKESELLLQENADTVRFMNLHKAKGLEGRIVIVCKRVSKQVFKLSHYSSLDDRDGRYHYFVTFCAEETKYTKKYYPAYAANTQIYEEAKNEETAEIARLDYVEATRAMEALIVLDAIRPDVGFNKYDFAPIKDLHKDFSFLFNTNAGNTGSGNNKNVTVYEKGRWDPAVTEEQKEQQYWYLSPSDLEKEEKKGNAQKNDKDNEETGAGDKDEKGRPSGDLFGIAMHRCYELMIARMRDNKTDETAQNSCVKQAVMEIMDDLTERYGSKADAIAETYLSYLQKLTAAFVTDKKITAILESDAAIYTEYHFSMYISRKHNPDVFAALEAILSTDQCKKNLPVDVEQNVWVNGTADLVAIYPDGRIHIVDYKSDDPGDLQRDKFMEVIHERYDGQMELYRQMMAIVFDTDIDKVTGEFYTTWK